MATETTPQHIEEAALAARLTMTQVFGRSGVSRGAFYRWKRGAGNMKPITRARMLDAIAELRLAALKGE